MKISKLRVSRTLEVPGQQDTEVATVVSFRNAENASEMLELCGGDLSKAMSYFNTGRWSESRTKVSNALANKTPAQRAVDKMITAFSTLNPKLSEGQVRQIVLAMPNIAESLKGGLEGKLPAEIDETHPIFSKSDETEGEPAEIAEAKA